LWRWCNCAAEATGIYQFIDNQAPADPIAGMLPASRQTPWPADRPAADSAHAEAEEPEDVAEKPSGQKGRRKGKEE